MHTYIHTRRYIYTCVYVCIQYDIMSMSSFWEKISLKIVLFSYIWHDHISLHDTSVKCPSDRNALFLFHMNCNNVDDWDANGSDRLFSTLRKWKQTGRSYVALQSTYRIIKIAICIGPDRSCCILHVLTVIPLVIFRDILEVYCSFFWLISIDLCIQTSLNMKEDQNCLESFVWVFFQWMMRTEREITILDNSSTLPKGWLLNAGKEWERERKGKFATKCINWWHTE